MCLISAAHEEETLAHASTVDKPEREQGRMVSKQREEAGTSSVQTPLGMREAGPPGAESR